MKRALISVYDKTGVVELAQALVDMGWEIISTGGTHRLLEERGLPVISIEDVTGFPEILDGRVKTLHPKIHAGILHRRNVESHVEKMKEMGLKSIDMVVNNLYPFEETLKKPGITHQDIIEQIDIGGPSMIRAAAKNYQDVLVVVDPKDYDKVIEKLQQDEVDLAYKQYLAGKVFTLTAYYDSLIAHYFNEQNGILFPDYYTDGYRMQEVMRYGENPHQEAAFYVGGHVEGTIADAKQLHGKALSYNNINDTNGAIVALQEMDEPACVAVKHSNPCGVAVGETILEAYEGAYACDPVSIFGGIVAFNRPVDVPTAEKLSEIFLEVIVAPAYHEDALAILSKKANIRLLQLDVSKRQPHMDLKTKKVDGGLLVQQNDGKLGLADLKVVSKAQPTEKDLRQLAFAWKVAKHVASNGVVLAKNGKTLGIGQGEVNRVWAVQEAVERAGEEAQGAYLASDGFFPFKDSIEALAAAGIKGVIQPGGSIRDQEVIDCADENGMVMIFTGMRHFRH